MSDARFPRAVYFSIINITITIFVLMLATFPDSGQCSLTCVPDIIDSCRKAANEDNNNCCCMDDLQDQKGQLSCDCFREVNGSASDVMAECRTLCKATGADAVCCKAQCAGDKACCDSLCVNNKHCMMSYLNTSTSQCFLFDNLVHQASKGEMVSVKKCTRSSARSVHITLGHSTTRAAQVLVVYVLVILAIGA